MLNLILFAASLLATSASAENLPIPPQLTRGEYIVSGKESDFCFQIDYAGGHQIVDGGKGIWLNAKTLLRLETESRVADDLRPGCDEHAVATSQDDGAQTILVSTLTTECPGKQPRVTLRETFTIAPRTISLVTIDDEGKKWSCAWHRKH